MTKLISRPGPLQVAVTISIFHPNNFTVVGHIGYLRTLYKDYDIGVGDEFDKKFYESIKEYFYDARTPIRKILIATQDFDRIVRRIKSEKTKEIILTVGSIISENMADDPFTKYLQIELPITLHYTIRNNQQLNDVEEAIKEAFFYVELDSSLIPRVQTTLTDLKV